MDKVQKVLDKLDRKRAEKTVFTLNLSTGTLQIKEPKGDVGYDRR